MFGSQILLNLGDACRRPQCFSGGACRSRSRATTFLRSLESQFKSGLDSANVSPTFEPQTSDRRM